MIFIGLIMIMINETPDTQTNTFNYWYTSTLFCLFLPSLLVSIHILQINEIWGSLLLQTTNSILLVSSDSDWFMIKMRLWVLPTHWSWFRPSTLDQPRAVDLEARLSLSDSPSRMGWESVCFTLFSLKPLPKQPSCQLLMLLQVVGLGGLINIPWFVFVLLSGLCWIVVATRRPTKFIYIAVWLHL